MKTNTWVKFNMGVCPGFDCLVHPTETKDKTLSNPTPIKLKTKSATKNETNIIYDIRFLVQHQGLTFFSFYSATNVQDTVLCLCHLSFLSGKVV